MSRFAQHTYRLHPAEDLFNPFALPLADLVSSMSRGSGVDGAAAPSLVVLRHMRRHIQIPHPSHEVPGVVSLVGGYRHALCPIDPIGHSHGRIAFRRATRLQQFRIHHQPVPVFDHHVAAIGQLGFVTAALARQTCIRVGGRLVRIVTALLAVKVDRGIGETSPNLC